MQLESYVDAFEQSVRSTLELVRTLQDEDWERPTDLPGWRVRDVVAHLAAVERELLGDPRAPRLEIYGPHVRDEFGQHMEDGVVARRTRAPAALVAELRDALEERLPLMRAMRAQDRPPRVVADQGWSTTELLRNRAFDAWMHEQDVRRAVTRPGNLDGPGANVTREIIAQALPILVARRARAAAGQSMRLQSTGALAFALTAVAQRTGRVTVETESSAEPTATLTLDWETLVRLIGGRMSANDAVVEVTGDRALARRLIDGFAITP
ncbi:MAG: maleylpyruvate isomerase family mycothiol-dependent enzyme [Actinomycetes bacterium]